MNEPAFFAIGPIPPDAAAALHAPLNAICGFAQLIQRGAGSGDPRDHAAKILHAGRHLLALLDGAQHVQSSAGATSPGAPPTAARVPAPTSVTLAGSVLCIDGEPLKVLLMRHFCAGFPTLVMHTAGGAEAGLRLARALAPGLILLEPARADADAAGALLAALRADPATAAIPVVALGTDAAPQRRRDALAAGFDDCWTQPFDFELIERRLATWLGGRPG